MTTDDTRPLGAEEEREVRQMAARIPDANVLHGLLATLDAERARHAALVAAAREVVRLVEPDSPALYPAFMGDHVRAGNAALAALRAALDGEPR